MNTCRDCTGPKVPLYRKYAVARITGLAEGDTVKIFFGTYGNGEELVATATKSGDLHLPDYEVRRNMYAQARIDGGKGSQLYVWLE